MSEKPGPASTPLTPGEKNKKVKTMDHMTGDAREAEAGANPVPGYLQNILNVVSKQKDFIKDITEKYKQNPEAINIIEVLTFLDDNTTFIEKLIHNAIEAFQLQDIGKQKLMKVMYTLSQLKEYLNELLGTQENLEKQLAINTGEKEPEAEKGSADREDKFPENKNNSIESILNNNTGSDTVAEPQNSHEDVESIAAELLVEEKKSPGNNKNIDDIIAEFTQKKKE